MARKTILVTGGAGYIGSHITLALLEKGQAVVVVDNLSTGYRNLVPHGAQFIEADVGNQARMKEIIELHNCTNVMHFAGSVVAPESIVNPLEYYRNNTVASLHLIQACIASNVEIFIFSSTAAVYGNPTTPTVSEDSMIQPLNPYGTSKFMIETVLTDAAKAHGLRYASLRYFNVAGADPQARSGQLSEDPTHLIKIACEVAVGKRDGLTVFGTDYDTEDGTCIRDFIHVTDLADAHVRVLDSMIRGDGNMTLNCGYGRGFSVRQVLDTFEKVTGSKLNVTEGTRRPGDSPCLVADTTRIRRAIGWDPRYDDMETIVKTALQWERSLSS